MTPCYLLIYARHVMNPVNGLMYGTGDHQQQYQYTSAAAPFFTMLQQGTKAVADCTKPDVVHFDSGDLQFAIT